MERTYNFRKQLELAEKIFCEICNIKFDIFLMIQDCTIKKVQIKMTEGADTYIVISVAKITKRLGFYSS